MKEIYCQITSGRGPVEVTRAVYLVQTKLAYEASIRDIRVQLIDFEEGTHEQCMFSCVLKLMSDDEEKLKKFQEEWQGSIAWIATKNPYRPHHKRTRWFVGCCFYERVQESTINEKDIQYQTTRSSGPGGQNVNKVETAVRATHNPSGISVLATDMRSQVQNKKLALERLIIKVSAIEGAKQMQQTHDVWMNHNTLERGNPIKKFKGNL